jgi:hypothetical protein
MTFQPYPTRTGFIFLAGTIIFGALATYLATLLPQHSDPPNIFRLILGLLLALGLMAIALYWALVAFKLSYHLNRNGLAIQWGLAQQQLIPFESIKEIIPAKELPLTQVEGGIKLAGLRFGWGQLPDHGPVKFYATTALSASLLVVTSHHSLFISPRQPENFIKAWQARQALGPTQHWSVGLRRSWPLSIPFLTDPVTWWLLSLALLACLALFGYISLIYPDLAPSLPIHFDSLGHADRTADKITLLMLPAAGAAVIVFNALLGSLIYRWEKVAAYLLWGSAVAIQIFLWAAMLTITASGT